MNAELLPVATAGHVTIGRDVGCAIVGNPPFLPFSEAEINAVRLSAEHRQLEELRRLARSEFGRLPDEAPPNGQLDFVNSASTHDRT